MVERLKITYQQEEPRRLLVLFGCCLVHSMSLQSLVGIFCNIIQLKTRQYRRQVIHVLVPMLSLE